MCLKEEQDLQNWIKSPQAFCYQKIT